MGKGLKIGIAIIAFAAAGVVYFITSRPEALPAEVVEATMVDLICESCGEHSQDTAENLDKVEVPGGVKQPGEGEGAVRRLARLPSKYPCPKCGQTTAVHARLCPDHNVYYPVTSADGGRGKCPQCP